MGDPDLEALAAAVERHFAARSGSRHVLSPRDFALLKSWHAAGMPLNVVLAGIDRAFAEDATVSSLGFCRRFVEAMAPHAGGERPGAARAADSHEDDLLSRLLALQAALRAAAAPAAFERAERRLSELVDLVSVAREPNPAYLREKLETLDRLVDEAGALALPAADAAAARGEAERALLRQGGRADAAALEDAARRYLVRRARERFALPRIGARERSA